MEENKFYTPIQLAECLMQMVPQREYENAIDICCGSWNLLKAAYAKLKIKHFVGVDVEDVAKEKSFRQADFYCQDGREFALQEPDKYDLILSNPPFGYLQDEQRKLQDLDGGIKHILSHKRYEMEMMQANLLLSKSGGVLLFVLPATFFEGETYLLARRELCGGYTVDSIIKLPKNTFGNAEICTYAIVLQNIGKQNKEAQLQEAIYQNGKWNLRFLKKISQINLEKGEWLGERPQSSDLKDPEIFRGNISSFQFSEKGEYVFHNSSVLWDGKWKPSVRYCEDQELIKKAKRVFPGDVIINRVGRGVNYWCLCEEEGLVSDCLLVIKNAKNLGIYDKLKKISRENRLSLESRGVATKYITKKDVLNLL